MYAKTSVPPLTFTHVYQKDQRPLLGSYFRRRRPSDTKSNPRQLSPVHPTLDSVYLSMRPNPTLSQPLSPTRPVLTLTLQLTRGTTSLDGNRKSPLGTKRDGTIGRSSPKRPGREGREVPRRVGRHFTIYEEVTRRPTWVRTSNGMNAGTTNPS